MNSLLPPIKKSSSNHKLSTLEEARRQPYSDLPVLGKPKCTRQKTEPQERKSYCEQVGQAFTELDKLIRSTDCTTLNDLQIEHTYLRDYLKYFSKVLSDILDDKAKKKALDARRPVEQRATGDKAVALLLSTIKSTELKIKVRLTELKSLDEQYEKQAMNMETHEVDSLIDDHQKELEFLKKAIVDLRREQTTNGRQLVKRSVEKKIDGDYIAKIEKLSKEINQIRIKTDEENKRTAKISENMDKLRTLVEDEKIQYLELRQKHEIDMDFDELNDKNLEGAEKQYWKLAARKTTIEDHIRAVENTTDRLRVAAKKELAALEGANKVLQETISEQEQMFLKQREQMEKAKIGLSKMQADQQEKVQRMEMDFLHSKMKKSVDDIYSNEISVHDKSRMAEKFDFSKDEKQPRNHSGKSQAKSLSLKKGPEENKFVKINFDGKDEGVTSTNKSPTETDSSPMDQKQLMKQVKNYDMDDQTKAFLENYLKDDTHRNDTKVEKEALPTGLSDEKPADFLKNKSPESPADKNGLVALETQIVSKDAHGAKPKT